MFRVREASIDEVLEVESRIVEFGGVYDPNRYTAELAGTEHLALVAVEDGTGRLIGYKVGYALDEVTFRSWFGGVGPDARGKGVATALRETQERWAAERGYERIRVGSKNQFPNMLRLLIGAGYQIVDVEQAPRGARIIFELELPRRSDTH